MKKELSDKLYESFPNLFYGGKVGISFKDGWFELLHNTCAALESLIVKQPEEDRRKYYCVQIKEKFGRLTLYLNDYTKEMSDVTGWTFDKSSEICEYCGGPGTIRSVRGWKKCLCDGHEDYRRLELETASLKQRLRYFAKLGEKLADCNPWLTNLAEIWKEEDDPDRPGQKRKVLVERIQLDTYQLQKAYESNRDE